MTAPRSGKLPLSNIAIKVAAKAYIQGTAREAIMAGLRADAPDHPMTIADTDGEIHPLPAGVTWLHARAGDGALTMATALAHSARARGRHIVWALPGTHSVPDGSGRAPDPRDVLDGMAEETVAFIETTFLDPGLARELAAEIRSRPGRSAVILKAIGPHGLQRNLDANGDLRVTLMEAFVGQPAGLLAQIGEGALPIRPDCLERAAGETHRRAEDAVDMAIARLATLPAAATHTARLEQVARACGYRSWHAAQGRKA